MKLLLALWIAAGSSVSTEGWQYTSWGMSEAEVVAASGGKASEVVGADRKGKGFVDAEARLKAPYQSGSYTFTAYFGFDRDTDELKAVSLDPDDSVDCVQLGATLSDKYGAPTDETNERGVFRIDVREWHEKGADTLVRYVLLGNPPDRSCSVTYRWTQTDEASGL